jgi:DNA-binding MarR family transcriptional regulator
MSTHAKHAARAQSIERFHHLAIRMLRGLRAVDEAAGFSGPRASALSVLVFQGPQSLGELAAAEGVKPPTMSRLVKAMREEGLVDAAATAHDQRQIRIAASARGRALMMKARRRRIDALARLFAGATPREIAALRAVVEMMDRALAPRA